MGSDGRIRSRQMRHDRAPHRDDVRKDWILERSGEERPVIWMYDLNMEAVRSVCRSSSAPPALLSESASESDAEC